MLDDMNEYTQLAMQSACRSLEDDRINSFDFFECPRRSSAGLLEATFPGHTLNVCLVLVVSYRDKTLDA